MLETLLEANIYKVQLANAGKKVIKHLNVRNRALSAFKTYNRISCLMYYKKICHEQILISHERNMRLCIHNTKL